MKSIKDWLKITNGWQRIWFVISVSLFLYFPILWALQQSGEVAKYRYDTKWTIDAEMQKPECESYMSQPFSQLTEPPYPKSTEGCYHIYTHRKFSDGNKRITREEYQSNFEKEQRETFLTHSGLGFLFATFWSALIYGLGFIVAWVAKGFRKKSEE